MDRQIDRQIERGTQTQTDMQTGRLVGRQRNRQYCQLTLWVNIRQQYHKQQHNGSCPWIWRGPAHCDLLKQRLSSPATQTNENKNVQSHSLIQSRLTQLLFFNIFLFSCDLENGLVAQNLYSIHMPSSTAIVALRVWDKWTQNSIDFLSS